MARNGVLKDSLESLARYSDKYDSTDAHEELVRNSPGIVHSLPTLNAAMGSIDLEAVIDIERYSSKLKLLKVTALVLWFVTYLKSRHCESNVNAPTAADLKEAKD